MNKRSKILNSAQQLFGQYGLKKVTTDDIAREAQVSKATIYKIYKNKQDILKDVVGHEMEVMLASIRGAVDAQDTVEGQLRAHLVTKIKTVHQLINLYNVTNETLAEHWGQAHLMREMFIQEESRILEEIMIKGMETGELEIANVKITASFMVISLQSLESPWAIEGLNVTVEEQVEFMLELMMNGLRKRN